MNHLGYFTTPPLRVAPLSIANPSLPLAVWRTERRLTKSFSFAVLDGNLIFTKEILMFFSFTEARVVLSGIAGVAADLLHLHPKRRLCILTRCCSRVLSSIYLMLSLNVQALRLRVMDAQPAAGLAHHRVCFLVTLPKELLVGYPNIKIYWMTLLSCYFIKRFGLKVDFSPANYKDSTFIAPLSIDPVSSIGNEVVVRKSFKHSLSFPK